MGRQGGSRGRGGGGRGNRGRGGGRRGGGGDGGDAPGGRGRGPRLDSRLLRQLDGGRKEEEVEEGGLTVRDFYEYEGVADEEAGKNRRYESVEHVEYELPSDFEDEEIDEDAALGEEDAGLEEPINTKTRIETYLDVSGLDLNSEEKDDGEDSEEEGDEDSEEEGDEDSDGEDERGEVEESEEEEEEEEEEDDDDEKYQQMLEAVRLKSHQPRMSTYR